MNEAMKIDNIKAYAKGLGIHAEDNFIYAIEDVKLRYHALFGGLANFGIKYFLICFDQEKIALMGLTLMGNFAEKDILIERSDIEDFWYEEKFLKGILYIVSKGEKTSFNIPRRLGGASWHTRNLENLRRKGVF